MSIKLIINKSNLIPMEMGRSKWPKVGPNERNECLFSPMYYFQPTDLQTNKRLAFMCLSILQRLNLTTSIQKIQQNQRLLFPSLKKQKTKKKTQKNFPCQIFHISSIPVPHTYTYTVLILTEFSQ